MTMLAIQQGRYARDGFTLSMDFEVKANGITAVLGPSGAGKSTLLNIIAGFEALQAGRIVLNHVDHSTTAPAQRPVSFVFQDNNSFAHLSARENVGLGLSPALRLSDAQWQVVDGALAAVGIGHLATRLPGDMSGGERQRIALGRALVRDRPILLLDEAFAALGPALRREMLDLVQQLQQQKALTVLMVTHNPEDARHIAENVIFVDEGQVFAPVATSAFLSTQDGAIGRYLGQF